MVNVMSDEIHVETTPVESAHAAEALAEVASDAIRETAERTEVLARAAVQLESVQRDFTELYAAFEIHVASNATDFAAILDALRVLTTRIDALESALIEESEDIEEKIREEIREEFSEAAAESVVEDGGVANVEAAQAEEPARFAPPEKTSEGEPFTKKGRHYIHRLF